MKKSQVTVFVIIGIIVIAAVGFAIYTTYGKQVKKEKFEIGRAHV